MDKTHSFPVIFIWYMCAVVLLPKSPVMCSYLMCSVCVVPVVALFSRYTLI